MALTNRKPTLKTRTIPFSFTRPNSEAADYDSNAEEKLQKQIIDRLFCPKTPISSYTKTRPMLELTLAGIGTISINENPVKCMFLTPPLNLNSFRDNQNDSQNNQPFPAIAVPLTTPSNNGRRPNEQSLLNLLQSAYQKHPMSKSKCLILNSIFINRDDALFDSLPWSTWSIGNHTFDMAGNPIDPKFHFGKRDAFQRFMGKDWPGRSLSLGNLAQKVLYVLEQSENQGMDDDTKLDEDAVNVLAKRILQLEISEKKAELAELQQQLAIFKKCLDDTDDENSMQIIMKVQDIQQTLQECENQLNDKQNALQELENPSSSQSIPKPSSILSSFLEGVVNWSNDNNSKAPPYRGAYGFSPMIDSKIEMMERSILPYTGPYDLLNDVLQEQLQANVIGCVLENTWILDDRIMVGGACVLQRKRGKKTMTIDGEEVVFYDEDLDELLWDDEDEFLDEKQNQKDTSKEVKGGEVSIVECDADEAIGLSLAIGSNVQISKELWENLNVMVTREANADVKDPLSNTTLPSFDSIKVIDSNELNIQQVDSKSVMESDDNNDSDDGNDVSKQQMRIPKTTAGFFSLSPESTSMNINTMKNNDDSPIQSLSELDNLTNPQKAKILRSLDSFQQSGKKLPRPRILSSSPTILTDFLLPYIDESVRRQYLIRQAIENNDIETANALKEQKSRRQVAKEMSETSEDAALKAMYEEESDFYADLRADVTQDEGSYSRFLDKDDWYERDRLKQAKRVKKSDFGTLLDGIE